MKDNIHTAVIMAGEFLSANEWIRRKNQLKTSVHPASVASFAPYGFNINQCDDDGNLWTNFPRPHIKLKIAPEKQLVFSAAGKSFYLVMMKHIITTSRILIWFYL